MEIWKQIPNYEGYYEVSNTGKIRSMNHRRKVYHGSYVMRGRELKPSFGSSGYLQVGLSKSGKAKAFYESLGEAERAVGINGGRSSIMRCCRGDYKTAYGFKWMFKEDYDNCLKTV